MAVLSNLTIEQELDILRLRLAALEERVGNFGRYVVGTYSGDATNPRTIATAVDPEFVIVYKTVNAGVGDVVMGFSGSTAVGTILRNIEDDGTTGNESGPRPAGTFKLTANGFVVGATSGGELNQTSGTYRYIVFQKLNF